MFAAPCIDEAAPAAFLNAKLADPDSAAQAQIRT